MCLTVPQAAERLGLCTKTVYRYVKDGRLPHYRLGPKLIFIDEQDLQNCIRKK